MLVFHRHWGLEYLLIPSEQWARQSEAHFLRRDYVVLDLGQAKLTLERIAREDAGFFRELADEILGCTYGALPAPGSEEQACEDERMLEALTRQLGSVFSKHGQPPHFARFYICRRKRVVCSPELWPDPWKDIRESIAAARRAPRGHVIVEVVTEAGAPVPQLRLEVLLADGEVCTRSTDSAGQLRLDAIPQGTCHVRVPTLDGDAWRPAEGPAATRVDCGHKASHAVAKGDSLSRIAKHYGIGNWKKIWEAADNQALRKKRKNPNVLLPGDEVVVPAIEVREIVRPTDQTHRIVVTRPRAVVALLNSHVLEDPESVGAHWRDQSRRLGATSSLHRDDTSMGLRVNDLFEQPAFALVVPAGSARAGGPSSRAGN